jgi:hypothetical protein
MESEGSSPQSQQPATCPYPEPDPTAHASHATSRRSNLRLGYLSGLLLSSFRTKTLYSPVSPIRVTSPALLSIISNGSVKEYLIL